MAKKQSSYQYYLRIIGSLLIGTIIYFKVDLKEIWGIITTINPLYLLSSFFLLFLSQVISALRMRYYYLANNIECSYQMAFKLYWIGMFYNSIIPGGIGGEGYKIYMMKKNEVPSLLSLRLAFANRFSGLYILVMITIILYLLSSHNYKIYAAIILSLIFVIYPIFAKIALKENLEITIKAGFYSLFIQIFSLLSASSILLSLGGIKINYLILFMFSSLVQILPISIAGIGVRELSFIYGANFFPVVIDIAISFSAAYFMVNLLLSLTGVMFINRSHCC